MYITDEIPVSCPTCGHFVSFSVNKCVTCSKDLSDIDLRELAKVQWTKNTERRTGFLWLVTLVGLCWVGLYYVTV